MFDTQMVIGVGLILIGVVGFARARRKHSNKTDGGWRINWSTGFDRVLKVVGRGWTIVFPVGPQAHLHYVQWYLPPTLRPGMVMTARIKVVGGEFIPIEYPDKPALVTLMIQRKGDNGSAEGVYEAYRQFSNATIQLVEGEHVLSIVLTHENFGGVYGKRSPAAFADVLSNVESIGVLFGSAGGRGHGVYSTGEASVSLLSLDVS